MTTAGIGVMALWGLKGRGTLPMISGEKIQTSLCFKYINENLRMIFNIITCTVMSRNLRKIYAV